MRRTTKKTRAELSEQDFLNFQELNVYVTGIGPSKLQQLIKQGLLPSQRVPGLWSRYDVDRWTGKEAPEIVEFKTEEAPEVEGNLQRLVDCFN